MSKIRDDLEGTVYLHTGGADGSIVLAAGDRVPKGYEVGEHLLAVDGVDGEQGKYDDGEPDTEPEPGVASEATSPAPEPDLAPTKRSDRKS